MPSPVAHGLTGLVLANLVRYGPARRPPWRPFVRPGHTRRAALALTGALMFAACAPDLDFLPGILVGDPDLFHRGPSHSLMAAALFGASAALLARLGGLRGAGRIGVAMGLAFASHAILDMFTTDPRRFNGVPLLWPLVAEHVMLPVPVFLNIERTPDAEGFIGSLLSPHNAHALVRECLVMGGVLVLGRVFAGLSAAGLAGRQGGRSTAVGTEVKRHLDSQS